MAIPRLDTPIQTLICMIISQRYNSYQLIVISFRDSGIFHFSSEIPWLDTSTVPTCAPSIAYKQAIHILQEMQEANTSWNQSVIKLKWINKICISDAANWRGLPKFASSDQFRNIQRQNTAGEIIRVTN